ncbi:MAG: effector binding domain-containing protein [Spirochaetales bacterium]|nr:effector binding domain-containing protein [Spirochaetales bacterium]
MGDSVKEYIRKRRMSEAGRELVNTKRSILSIAIDYGYNSQEAFSRSFLHSYGLTPGVFRRKRNYYALRAKMTANYLLFEYKRRRHGMIAKLVKKNKITVIGKKITVKCGGQNRKEIPLFWSKWINNNFEKVIPLKKNKNQQFGICVASKSEKFDYIIGCEVAERASVPPDFIKHTIPPALYAVFSAEGPVTESVQKTWDYIFATWFPEADYEYAESDSFELYYCKDNRICTDIYIPVKEKNKK